MGEFGVPEAQIVGLFMEAVFYGEWPAGEWCYSARQPQLTFP